MHSEFLLTPGSVFSCSPDKQSSTCYRWLLHPDRCNMRSVRQGGGAALTLRLCLVLQAISTKDTFTFALNLEYLEVRFVAVP